jgi:hypothetical protein
MICELCAQESKLGYRSFWTIAGHSYSQTSFEGITGPITTSAPSLDVPGSIDGCPRRASSPT